MFWEQGEDHLHALSSQPTSKYAQDWRCVWAWRQLNPHWEVRLLDAEAAFLLAPTYYGDLIRRNLTTSHQHLADVLRLELLLRCIGRR
jgi:hypothetical protein